MDEAEVEHASLAWYGALGDAVVHGPEIAEDGATPERGGYDDVLLVGRLRAATDRLNPEIRPRRGRRRCAKCSGWCR